MCLQVTLPSAPSLGGGLSLAPPTLPTFGGNIDTCCKHITYTTPSISLPLGPGVFNPAVSLALSNAIDAVQLYINGFLPSCPLE